MKLTDNKETLGVIPRCLKLHYAITATVTKSSEIFVTKYRSKYVSKLYICIA